MANRPPPRKGRVAKVGSTTASIRRSAPKQTVTSSPDIHSLYKSSVEQTRTSGKCATGTRLNSSAQFVSSRPQPAAAKQGVKMLPTIRSPHHAMHSRDDDVSALEAEFRDICGDDDFGSASPADRAAAAHGDRANIPSSRPRPKQAAHGVKLLPTLKPEHSSYSNQPEPAPVQQAYVGSSSQNDYSQAHERAVLEQRREQKAAQQQQAVQQKQLYEQQLRIEREQQKLEQQRKEIELQKRELAQRRRESQQQLSSTAPPQSPSPVADGRHTISRNVQVIDEEIDGKKYKKEVYVTKRVVGGPLMDSTHITRENTEIYRKVRDVQSQPQQPATEPAPSPTPSKAKKSTKPAKSKFILPRNEKEARLLREFEEILTRLRANDKTLKRVELDQYNLNKEAMCELGDALYQNTRLRVLKLEDNPIGNEGLAALLKALQTNTTVHTLNINKVGGLTFAGVQQLEVLIPRATGLRALYIQSNNLGIKGAKVLAKMLTKNTSLTSLFVGYNKIQNEGAMAFRDALDENTTLLKLTFGEDRFRPDIIKSIDAKLRRNKEGADAQTTRERRLQQRESANALGV